MGAIMKSNIASTEEFRTANKLTELVVWLENNRRHLTAIIERPAGSHCRATVLQAMRDLQYEIYQWLLHLPK